MLVLVFWQASRWGFWVIWLLPNGRVGYLEVKLDWEKWDVVERFIVRSSEVWRVRVSVIGV